MDTRPAIPRELLLEAAARFLESRAADGFTPEDAATVRADRDHHAIGAVAMRMIEAARLVIEASGFHGGPMPEALQPLPFTAIILTLLSGNGAGRRSYHPQASHYGWMLADQGHPAYAAMSA